MANHSSLVIFEREEICLEMFNVMFKDLDIFGTYRGNMTWRRLSKSALTTPSSLMGFASLDGRIFTLGNGKHITEDGGIHCKVFLWHSEKGVLNLVKVKTL